VSYECELLPSGEAEFSVVFSLVKDKHNFDCKIRYTLITLQIATRGKSDRDVIYRFFFPASFAGDIGLSPALSRSKLYTLVTISSFCVYTARPAIFLAPLKNFLKVIKFHQTNKYTT
jgi:hypothetical protein